MPFASVITVCRNSSKTIARTIESILKQTCQDFEYIVVDGNSTDNTVEICKSFQNDFNGRMRIVSESDRGIYDAMNKGIRLSSGVVVGIVNSDDYYEPDTLEKVKKVFNPEYKYQIIYGMIRNVTSTGEIDSIHFCSHNRMEKEMIPHPACFVTNAIYKDKGAYSLEYKSSSDYDFLLRMYKDDEVMFVPVYSVLSNFTLGGTSSKVDSHIETFKVWKKYGCITNKRYWLITLSTYAKAIVK